MSKEALIARLKEEATYDLNHQTIALLIDAADALAQPEPVKIAHKHEWFRTGEMKVGQMRCISCGTWGQEEIPQRTWVGLTKNQRREICHNAIRQNWTDAQMIDAVENNLKEKNT